MSDDETPKGYGLEVEGNWVDRNGRPVEDPAAVLASGGAIFAVPTEDAEADDDGPRELGPEWREIGYTTEDSITGAGNIKVGPGRVFIAPVGTEPPHGGSVLYDADGWPIPGTEKPAPPVKWSGLVPSGMVLDEHTRFAPDAEIRVAEHLKDGSGDVIVDDAKVDEDGNLRIDATVVGAVAEHFQDAALHGVSLERRPGVSDHTPVPVMPQMPREMHMEFQLPAWEGDRRRMINTIVGKVKKEPTYTVPNRADRRRAAKKKGRQ